MFVVVVCVSFLLIGTGGPARLHKIRNYIKKKQKKKKQFLQLGIHNFAETTYIALVQGRLDVPEAQNGH